MEIENVYALKEAAVNVKKRNNVEIEDYKTKFAKFGYSYVAPRYNSGQMGQMPNKDPDYFEYVTEKKQGKKLNNSNGWAESKSSEYDQQQQRSFNVYTYSRVKPTGYPKGILYRNDWAAALEQLQSMSSAQKGGKTRRKTRRSARYLN